jgi:phosphopantothenoylcysteine decarboxylase
MNILLGVTGSVAAVLTPKLVQKLTEGGHIVTVVMTDTAPKFLKEKIPYYKDEDEWGMFNEIGDPILHIKLRKWADILLIAPCTMNTLGKIANGLCDNLLTNIARAWDYSKPFFIGPAANTYMWDSPITKTQLKIVEELGIRVIPPISKTLACGDTGVGAMADIKTIIEYLEK